MRNIPRKELQRQRMMAYFIDAAHHVIETEGIQAVTIRKVADLAGYNSATIYNYFENLDHLISYASIKYLKEYYLSLEEYIKGAKDTKERFLLIWKKFCIHCYQNPEIFKTIFFGNIRQSVTEIFNDYFSIYPSDFGEHSSETLPMLSEGNIYARNKKVLQFLVTEDFIKMQDLDELNEVIVTFYRGILARILDRNENEEIDLEEEINKTIRFINKIINLYQ